MGQKPNVALGQFSTGAGTLPGNDGEGENNGLPVIGRKVMLGNRGGQGALDRGVLMTVFRPSKRRGYNPIATLVYALREYIRTGRLRSFPLWINSGAWLVTI